MAKRKETLLEKRRRYIAERLDKAKQTTKEVRKLAAELYITERTVWRDYKAVER